MFSRLALARSLIALTFLSCAASLSFSQTTVDMRVTLEWSRGRGPQDSGMPGVANRGSSIGESHGMDAATSRQITIRVIADSGQTIAEASPDTQGTATFTVTGQVVSDKGNRFYPVYRIRVFGSNIDEAWADNVQPGLGDRMVTIRIHAKGEKPADTGKGGAMISAATLAVPPKAEREFDKGNQALTDGKLPEARKHFEAAIALYPQYDTAYNNLGVTLMKSGDAVAGKQAFEKALAVNDKFARAYVNLARIAMQEKSYAEASALLKKAISSEPLNAEALSMLAQASYLTGDYDVAVESARRMHDVPHPGLALGHFAAAGSLEKLNRPAEAVVEYQLFLQEAPQSPLAEDARRAIARLQPQ